jgi:hypothetical protein
MLDRDGTWHVADNLRHEMNGRVSEVLVNPCRVTCCTTRAGFSFLLFYKHQMHVTQIAARLKDFTNNTARHIV